MDAVILAFA